VYNAFEYNHRGNLAYVANATVFDLNGMGFLGGLIFLYLWGGVYLWEGIYFGQGVSPKTSMLLTMDWMKRALFGGGLLID
jgi:NADH dehydrogenase